MGVKILETSARCSLIVTNSVAGDLRAIGQVSQRQARAVASDSRYPSRAFRPTVAGERPWCATTAYAESHALTGRVRDHAVFLSSQVPASAAGRLVLEGRPGNAGRHQPKCVQPLFGQTVPPTRQAERDFDHDESAIRMANRGPDDRGTNVLAWYPPVGGNRQGG